jgi:nicotinamidase-related amidase
MRTRAKDLYGSVPDKNPVALLIIDVINDFQFPEAEQLLIAAVPMSRNLKALASRARRASVPIIYINDNFGKWRSDFSSLVNHCVKGVGRKVVQNLLPKKKDYFVLKPKHSAFYSTSLSVLLECLGARTLIITGIASNICVLFTANDAYMRDYKIKVPGDCVCANTQDENTNALNQIEKLLKADVSPSHKIMFKHRRALSR